MGLKATKNKIASDDVQREAKSTKIMMRGDNEN
jgi:hypothetical protein